MTTKMDVIKVMLKVLMELNHKNLKETVQKKLYILQRNYLIHLFYFVVRMHYVYTP